MKPYDELFQVRESFSKKLDVMCDLLWNSSSIVQKFTVELEEHYIARNSGYGFLRSLGVY